MDNEPEPINDAESCQKLKSLKKNTTVCFPLMGSSGEVETY